ncbi:MAG: hypothetical protein QME52_07860, partial [Bacteroidota bacterium]|nr:hypothetical protein [Bacteroidota bacterium]
MRIRKIEIICTTFRCLGFVLCTVVCNQQVDAQQLIWQRVFDTGVEDYATGITSDIYGNIIVTGRSALQTSSGSCLTIKYNQSGDTI